MQSTAFDGIATAGQAVNGLRTGGHAFHTMLEVEPWWMVDLGTVLHIGEVRIFNRLDGLCRIRARNLSLLLSADGEHWSVAYRHDGTVFGGIDGAPLCIPCHGTVARFVRVKLVDYQYLHLDQVEVYVGK